MSDKLQAAKALAAKGFRVFPLIENGKLPAIQGWPTKATSDTAQIERWWGPDPATGWEPDYNIGVVTGGELAVLDVDNKHGVNGDASLDQVSGVNDIPVTFSVRTPSGGRHLYYAVSSEVRNSAARIGPGLDVRGKHGFVVAPGSTIEGAPYSCENDSPIARCPVWLETLCQKAPAEDRANDPAVRTKVTLDLPAQARRAVNYLRSVEPAIEGAGGDHHTFKVICGVKDLGISESLALDLLLDNWNDRCAPPWQPEDLQTKIHNAYRYGDQPIGISDPAMDFEPVTLATAQSSKLHFEMFDDVVVDTTSVPLVENYLDQQALSVLYGESNVGKTFIAADIAFHIATGRKWSDSSVEQGGVVYVAAEGGKGIRKRFAALKKHFKAANVPLALVPCSINLLGRKPDTDALITLIDKATLQMSCPVHLVVIDTLARAIAGGNENASEDMGALVQQADKLRAATQAHVMFVHHSGKDTAKGARGHSSLRAATDTELEVVDGTLQVRKQRDGEYAEMRPFVLKPVVLGIDARGKDITSCVVEWPTGGGDFVVAPTPDEMVCLQALNEATVVHDWVTAEQVATAYNEIKGTGGEAHVRTVRRWLSSLEGKQAVKRSGNTRFTKWAPAGSVA